MFLSCVSFRVATLNNLAKDADIVVPASTAPVNWWCAKPGNGPDNVGSLTSIRVSIVTLSGFGVPASATVSKVAVGSVVTGASEDIVFKRT